MIVEMWLEFEARRAYDSFSFRSPNEGGIPQFNNGFIGGLHIIEVPEAYQAGPGASGRTHFRDGIECSTNLAYRHEPGGACPSCEHPSHEPLWRRL